MNPDNEPSAPTQPQTNVPDRPQEQAWQPASDTIVDREPSTTSRPELQPQPRAPYSVAPAPSPEPTSKMVTPAAAPVAERPRSKKPLIAGIAIGVALLLLGGSAAAYQFWYQNPDKVVTDSIMKALTAKTMSYTGSADMTGDSAVKVALTGAASDGAFTTAAKVTMTSGAASIVVDADAQTHKNGDMYFRIKNAKDLAKSFFTLSGMSSNEAIDAFVAKVDNKWVKLTAKDLDSQTNSSATSCTTDAVAFLQKDAPMRREVTDAYAKQRFIVVKESLGEKNGSLGYKLDFDETKAKAFVGDLKKTKLYSELQKCDKDFTIDEKDVTGGEKSDTATTVEIWANKWTHDLTKLNIGASQNAEKVAIVMEPTFNKPVTITAPADAITYEQLKEDINNLMSSFMGGASLASDTEAMTDAEMSAMEMQLMGTDVEQ